MTVRRVPITVLTLAAASVVITACGGGVIPEPASRQGETIASTWAVFLWTALAVALVVWGLIAYAVIRFRRRDDDTIPKQTRSNPFWETVYTAIPVIIVGVLFVVSARAIANVQALSPPDVVVDVTAYQWGWTFDYPDLGVTVHDGPDIDPVMVLPVDSTVRLTLRSEDVIHSFFVPDFLWKHDVIPGQVFDVDVDPTRTGTFVGRCAEFCGLQHDQMTFRVEVVSETDFQTWVAQSKGSS